MYSIRVKGYRQLHHISAFVTCLSLQIKGLIPVGLSPCFIFFFFNDRPPTEFSPLPLPDALPILSVPPGPAILCPSMVRLTSGRGGLLPFMGRWRPEAAGGAAPTLHWCLKAWSSYSSRKWRS